MNLEPIDTSTTAGKARVKQLAAEGRKVAALMPTQPMARWVELDHPVWDWFRTQYGVIAEPVGPDEVWLTYADSGALQCTSPSEPSWDVAGVKHLRYIRADLAGRDE